MGRLDDNSAIEARQRFVEGWNNTMVDIWQERIFKLGVIDTSALWRSQMSLPVQADGRFYDFSLSQTFLEYGIWQDLGVGRELRHGDYEHNRKHIEEHGRKRVARRWFSPKYYSSVLRLRDFMADSLGAEFVGMFAHLDADEVRKNTEYYKSRGWS